MDICLMDVFKLDDEYRIVVRDGSNFNRFCLISMGTGESNGPMDSNKLYAYLSGKNPLNAVFEYCGNLVDEWKNLYPSMGNYARISVPKNDFKPEAESDKE